MSSFVIAISLTAAILFFTLVLSVMAAQEADKKNPNSLAKARDYSTYAAVTAGFAFLTLLVGLFLHGVKPSIW